MGQNIDLRSVIPSFHRRRGIVGAGFRLQEEILLKDRIIDKLTMSQYIADCTATNLNVNYRYGGLPVGDCETEDSAGIRCPLMAIVRQPTLVFRYCDRACGECISFGADKLARELEGSNIPVVFLARYDNIQEMRRQGPRINPWGFRMLNVEKYSIWMKNCSPITA